MFKSFKEIIEKERQSQEKYRKIYLSGLEELNRKNEIKDLSVGQYRDTWHFLHLVMTLLTGGLWILVWLWRGLSNADHNKRLDRRSTLFNQINKESHNS